MEAVVSAPLAGSVLDVLYPKNLTKDTLTLLERGDTYQVEYFPLVATIDDRVIRDILKRLDRLEKVVFSANYHTKKEPTGLIIDARGTNFIPSLKPKVYKIGSNRPIYPDGVMVRDDIVNNFCALFARSLEDARENPRVGDYPITIRGLKTYGKWRNVIVVGKKGAHIIQKYKNSEFLTSGRVIIVVQ